MLLKTLIGWESFEFDRSERKGTPLKSYVSFFQQKLLEKRGLLECELVKNYPK